MRTMFAALALPFLAGSAAAGEPPAAAIPPAETAEPALSAEACRDRIMEVREERGLPMLRSESAEPDSDAEGLLFYAVDRDIDGCDVLVMAGNPRDVRPLPQFDREDWRVRPAARRAQ